METSGTAYLELLERVTRFRWHIADQFAAVDLILTPSAAGLLWPKSEPYPKKIAGQNSAPRASAIYTTFGNLAGLAAISIPGGRSAKGHPIGVQIAGPPGSEELILNIAEQFESVQPWPFLATDNDQAPLVRKDNFA
jgi:Asp-tRNA(Asn)/Glu-tRNA(Gln) amidotransferase A subunit family amidase